MVGASAIADPLLSAEVFGAVDLLVTVAMRVRYHIRL